MPQLEQICPVLVWRDVQPPSSTTAVSGSRRSRTAMGPTTGSSAATASSSTSPASTATGRSPRRTSRPTSTSTMPTGRSPSGGRRSLGTARRRCLRHRVRPARSPPRRSGREPAGGRLMDRWVGSAAMGEIIEFPSNGGTATATWRCPKSGGGIPLVVIQEWWGLVPHIKDVCERFAAEGFVALAPDLYHGESHDRADEAGKLMMALNVDQAARDMGGAVDEVAEVASGDRVGVTGFCMGGGLALVLAVQRPDKVKAVRALVRHHPLAERPARLVDARRPGARPLRREGRLLHPRGGRRADDKLTPGKDAGSSWTPVSTTPSSTTPDPRSTTRRCPPRPGP